MVTKSIVTTSDGIQFEIQERGLIGINRYVIGELTGLSNEKIAIPYTQGGIGELNPKLFGFDKIIRVNLELSSNIKNRYNYNNNNGKFEVYQFPDMNSTSSGLDTITRQSGDDITFLGTILPNAVTSSDDRIYFLTSSKVYVYDWDGNRQSLEEFDLEDNGGATPNGITILSNNIIYVSYSNGDIHAYYHEESGGSHRAQHSESILLDGLLANNYQYMTFYDDREKVYVANSDGQTVHVFNYDGVFQFNIDLRQTLNRIFDDIHGISLYDDKLWIINSSLVKIIPFSLSNILDRSISLDDTDNNNPQGIAVNDDRIFVYDHTSSNILLYNRVSGNLESSETIDTNSLASLSLSESQLMSAIGEDNLYLVDNNKIYNYEKQDDDSWTIEEGFSQSGTKAVQNVGNAVGVSFYNGHLYVANLSSDSIRVIVAATNTRVTSLDIDVHDDNGSLRDISVSATRIYVTDSVDGTLFVYDHSGVRQDGSGTTTDEEFVITADATGLSHTSTRLYILYRSGLRIYSYAGVRQNTQEFALHSDNSSPSGIFVTSTRIYIGDSGDDRIYVYDHDGNRQSSEEWNIPNTNISGLASDGTSFFVSGHNSNTLVTYSNSTESLFDLHSSNSNPEAFAVSSDRFYVYDSGLNRMFSYDEDGDRQNSEEFNLSSVISGAGVVDMAYDEINELFYVYGENNNRVYAYHKTGGAANVNDFDYNNRVTGVASHGGQLYFSIQQSMDDDTVEVYSLRHSRIENNAFDLELSGLGATFHGLANNGSHFYVAIHYNGDDTYISFYNNQGVIAGSEVSLNIDDVIDIELTVNRLYVLAPDGGTRLFAFNSSSIARISDDDIYSAESGFEGVGLSRGHMWFLRDEMINARTLNGLFPPVDLPDHLGVRDIGSDSDDNIYILLDGNIAITDSDGVSTGDLDLQGRTPEFIHLDSNNRIFMLDEDGEIIKINNSTGNKIGVAIELDTNNDDVVDLLSDVSSNRVYAIDSNDSRIYAYAIVLSTTSSKAVEYTNGVDLLVDDIKGLKFLAIGV